MPKQQTPLELVINSFGSGGLSTETKRAILLLNATPKLLEALKRDSLLADTAILLTPTGPDRNRLTEINILRLAAIAAAEESP